MTKPSGVQRFYKSGPCEYCGQLISVEQSLSDHGIDERWEQAVADHVTKEHPGGNPYLGMPMLRLHERETAMLEGIKVCWEAIARGEARLELIRAEIARQRVAK